LADGGSTFAGVFPAAAGVLPESFLATFGNGFFLTTGFVERRVGALDFFEPRPDLAGADFFFAGFFFAGFFAAVFPFDGLDERFGARALGAVRLRAGFACGFALRLAFALDLGRDFFTGFEAFLTMVVLLLGCGLGGARTAIPGGISRHWGKSGKLQIITCA